MRSLGKVLTTGVWCCMYGIAVAPWIAAAEVPKPAQERQAIANRFADEKPTQWGTKLPGVYARFETDKKEVALTFDACRAGFDADMFAVLERENIPATVFLSGPWLKLNADAAKKLAASPLLEIGNHGANHRPLSVTGRGVYHLQGTKSPAEVIAEIEDNADQIEQFTGRRPRLFRPATGYCDDVAVRIANDLGYAVATFDVLGDEGATLTDGPMVAAITKARPGDIVIVHINHPRPGAAPALEKAIQKLRNDGYTFVKLGDRITQPRSTSADSHP